MNEDTRKAIETTYQAAVNSWFLAQRHNDKKSAQVFDAAASAIRNAWLCEIDSYLGKNGIIAHREEGTK